ncbi:Jag N-terminal domain-containing protein [Acidaminococcus intestini]|nr:Jag N-terminal domain-containing protein [Acidaminococcus intestini]
MNRIEKTGRTVDDAVQAALKELGVSREDVLIEVLEEGKDALLDSSSGTPRYGLL